MRPRPNWGQALLLGMGLGIVTFAFGCGGGGSSSGPPPPPPPPVVTLTSLSPIVATQNAPPFTLTANGSNFGSSSQIVFNGTAKTTTPVSATQLTAQIASSDIATAGTFPVAVLTSGSTTSSLSFYVVPAITPQSVPVFAGALLPPEVFINIAVQTPNPPFVSNSPLSIVALGIGTTAGATGIEVKQGGSANVFLVGKGVAPGTFYVITGNSKDVTVTQPLASDFSTTTDGIPAVNFQISVNTTAATGPRNILVTNGAGEMTVFVGGLLITSGP